MSSLAYSIGKDKRKDESVSPMTKIVPGPGTYNYNDRTKKDAPKWGFGTHKRPQLNQKMQYNVGPGQYSIKSRAVEGSHFSMA